MYYIYDYRNIFYMTVWSAEEAEEIAWKIGGYYTMENVTAYIKKRGFNEFYKVKYDVRMSNHGYKIAVPHDMEKNFKI